MIKSYKFSFLWLCFVTGLSLMPGENFGENNMDGLDKVIHIIFYSVLTLFLSVANIKQLCAQHRYSFRPILVAFLFSIFWGIMMEIIQGTVFVSRTIETMDILANVLGALLGILCFYIIYGHPNNYYTMENKKSEKADLGTKKWGKTS